MSSHSLVAVTALALVGLAGCHRIDPTNPEHQARISSRAAGAVEDALDELDATDAQRKVLDGIEKPVLTEAFTFFAGHDAAKKEMWAEWSKDQADAAKVHAQVDERIDGMRKVAHAAADASLKIHDTLTPEQRKHAEEEWRRKD